MKTKPLTLAKLFPKNERKDITFPLEGKYLIIDPKKLKPEYQKRKFLVVKATGGFGCIENARGSAVFTECVGDGENARYERYEFVAEFVGDIEALKKEI